MMKAKLIAFLPLALLASCTKNQTTAQAPAIAPPVANPYGVPQSEVGQYTPDATPYQPVQPINPPAIPSGAAAPPPVVSAPTVTPSIPSTYSSTASASSHVVIKGDSLWGLSRKYGVTSDAIRQANGMAAGDNIIRTGQTLQIPSR